MSSTSCPDSGANQAEFFLSYLLLLREVVSVVSLLNHFMLSLSCDAVSKLMHPVHEPDKADHLH